MASWRGPGGTATTHKRRNPGTGRVPALGTGLNNGPTFPNHVDIADPDRPSRGLRLFMAPASSPSRLGSLCYFYATVFGNSCRSSIAFTLLLDRMCLSSVRALSRYRVSRPKESRPTQEHGHRGAKACMLDAPLLHASLLSTPMFLNLGRRDGQYQGTRRTSDEVSDTQHPSLCHPPSTPKKTHSQRSSSSRAPLPPPPVRPPNQTQSKHRAHPKRCLKRWVPETALSHPSSPPTHNDRRPQTLFLGPKPPTLIKGRDFTRCEGLVKMTFTDDLPPALNKVTGGQKDSHRN